MATPALERVIQHLRRVAALENLKSLPDGELLHRYVERADSDAFGVLVRRHGPMVLGV